MNDCETESTKLYSSVTETSQDYLKIYESTSDENPLHPETKTNESTEKHSAIWNTKATSKLLKLYEEKLDMIETPKKKRRIWIAISESLRHYNIDMSPDQVRWKINALTKKYTQCLHTGQYEKFQYFKEIDNIYLQYNTYYGDGNTASDFLNKKLDLTKKKKLAHHHFSHETRAMIQMRKIRLANRIESDRSQGKIQLEKQWLQYLQKQEEQNRCKDEICERNLRLHEKELELKKRKIELKEMLEYKKIEQMEKKLNNILQIEREKCVLFKELLVKG